MKPAPDILTCAVCNKVSVGHLLVTTRTIFEAYQCQQCGTLYTVPDYECRSIRVIRLNGRDVPRRTLQIVGGKVMELDSSC